MFFYQISTLTDEVNTFDHVGNATVKGLIGGGDKVETWGVADTIAGGTAGSKMDLTAIVGTAGAADPSTVGRFTSGIETFNITFKDANDKASNSLTVDTSSLAGAKNFNIVSATASRNSQDNTSDKVEFTGLAQDQMVTIKSADKDLGVVLGYSDAASAGKEDVASFSLHNAKVGSVVSVGMETVKVTATGDNEVAMIRATGTTKFVIDGAGKLDAKLSNIDGGQAKAIVTDIDASAMKGSLDLTISTAELNTTKAVITGGTATDDVLNVNGAINAKMTVSGFETVGLDESTTAPTDFVMTNVTGATTVANFSGAALTVKNATGVTNLLMEGNGSANVTSDVGIGAITFEAKALQDKLDVAINNAGVALGDVSTTTEAVINAGALNINNVKNITIAAADADVVLGGLVANKMESLTVTAAEDFTIGGTTTFHKDAVVNMAGVVGDVTMSMQGNGGSNAFTTALDYTGSLAADHLTLGALAGTNAGGVVYDIKTGAGNDEVTLSGAIAVHANAALNLNLGEGNDTLTVGAAAVGEGQTIDFGAGTDTLVYKGVAVDLSTSTVSDLQNIKISGSNGLTINNATAKDLGHVTFSETGTLTVKIDPANEIYDASKLIIDGANNKFAIIGSTEGDTITANDHGTTITGGKGADKITLGAGVDTVNFTVSDTADVISSFTTTSDKMHFAGIEVAGGGAISATTGTAVTSGNVTANALTNNTIYVINNGGTGLVSGDTTGVATYTDLASVATYLGKGYNATAADNAAIFVINDLAGHKSYVYSFGETADTASTISADELKLIGVVTESTGAALVIGNIA